MIFGCSKCVFFSYFPIPILQEKFQIHHIVDDNGDVPRSPVPAADDAGLRDEPGGQGVGTAGEDGFRGEFFFVALGKARGAGRKVAGHFAERGHQLEADVVVRLAVQPAGKGKGVPHGESHEPGIFRLLENLPQHPRVEPAGPPAEVAGHEGVTLEGAGAEPVARWPVGAGHDGKEAVHIHGLHLREREHAFVQLVHRLFVRGARSARDGRECGEQKQASHRPKIQ